jgi:cell division septation protein DedD
MFRQVRLVALVLVAAAAVACSSTATSATRNQTVELTPAGATAAAGTARPSLEVVTLRPSAIPPTTPPPPPATLRFTSVKSPVSRGGTASASVATTAGASCSIVVTYKSGPSTAAGLTPRSADGGGAATWSWTVGANTTPGDWPIDVTCNGARAHTTFTVQ